MQHNFEKKKNINEDEEQGNWTELHLDTLQKYVSDIVVYYKLCINPNLPFWGNA